MVFLKVHRLPADNAQRCRGVHRSRLYVRPNGVRLNIVSFRYHLTEQTVHESIRALLTVRAAPLACIDTCRLHLILKTLLCDQ